MRTPICTLELADHSLPVARRCVRAAADLVALPPLPRAAWCTAVSVAARAAASAGGATLALLLDDDARALVAEVGLKAGPSGAALDPFRTAPDLARARGLLGDDLAATQEAGAAHVLTLRCALPPQAPPLAEAEVRRRIEAVLQQPSPSAQETSAEHDAEVLDLLEGAQAGLDALRSAQGQVLDTLAHDLRSPLLTLNLSLEMLRIKPHDAAQLEERREVMKRQADQLKALAAGLRQHAPAMPPLPSMPDAGETHAR